MSLRATNTIPEVVLDFADLITPENLDEENRNSNKALLFDSDDDLNVELTTAEECLSSERKIEGSIIFGIIFKLVHANKSGETTSPYNFSSQGYGNTRMKAKPTFDRMIYVADLNNQGASFVMIFSRNEASRILDPLKEDSIIAKPVIIREPSCNKGNRMQNLPVIESRYKIIALDRAIINALPPKLYAKPSQGSVVWWLYHQTELNFSCVQMCTKNTVYQPSCSGVLCDRQATLQANGSCGCYHKAAVSEAAVLEGTPECKNIKSTSSIQTFRSLMWTQLCVQSLGVLARMPDSDLDYYTHIDLRRKVKNLHTYVNNHGGYTLFGYSQLGESSDICDKTNKIGSVHPTIRLVYVHPDNLKLQSTTDYKNHMFNLSNDYENIMTTSNVATVTATTTPNINPLVSQTNNNATSRKRTGKSST